MFPNNSRYFVPFVPFCGLPRYLQLRKEIMAKPPGSTGSKCLKHPDEEAESRCSSCRKPICEKCIVKKPEGIFCSDECWNKGKQHQDRWKAMKAKEAKFDDSENSRRKALFLKIAFFLALLAGIAGMVKFSPGNPVSLQIKVVLQKVGLMK